MTFKEIMMAKAIETVDMITDPVARANAIAQFLKAYVDESIDLDAAVTEAAKPVEEKPSEKPAKAIKGKTDKKTKAEPSKPAPEADKPKEAAPEPVNAPAPEPVAKAVTEEAPVIEDPKPETVEKVKDAVEKVEPYEAKDKETADERQARQAVLVKAFGGETLGEILTVPEKKRFFAAELKAIGAFRNFFLNKFGITFDENGVEHNAGNFTSQQVDNTVHHYIHECGDETSSDWKDIKVDKFITVFIPYMMSLDTLFATYTYEQIIEAGRKMTRKSDFSLGRINHETIDALHYILNPEAKLG